MAPRSPFLVTAPDDFWIPGRGALGEATGGALASPDMLVPSAATLGTLTGARRQDGILWGSPWRWPNQGSLFRVHRRDPPAAASPQRPSPRQPREVGGPEGKGQPQSAREADRGHHRVIRGRKEPGGRSRGTRAAEKGGARAEPGQPRVTGAGEPWSPGGPDPADPVRKEKDLGGAVAEGDERISYWTGVEGAGLERDQDGEAGLGGGQGAVQSHPRN